MSAKSSIFEKKWNRIESSKLENASFIFRKKKCVLQQDSYSKITCGAIFHFWKLQVLCNSEI